jgi:quinol monooxygenase YgiN
MIKVVASNFVQEKNRVQYLELVKELVKLTKANDQGCLKYELFEDNENPNLLTFIEEWESKKALDEHLNSKHFKRIVPLLHSFLTKEGTLNIYSKIL